MSLGFCFAPNVSSSHTPKISLSHFNRKHVCFMFSVTFIVRERTESALRVCTCVSSSVSNPIHMVGKSSASKRKNNETKERKVQAVASFTRLYFHIVGSDNRQIWMVQVSFHSAFYLVNSIFRLSSGDNLQLANKQTSGESETKWDKRTEGETQRRGRQSKLPIFIVHLFNVVKR